MQNIRYLEEEEEKRVRSNPVATKEDRVGFVASYDSRRSILQRPKQWGLISSSSSSYSSERIRSSRIIYCINRKHGSIGQSSKAVNVGYMNSISYEVRLNVVWKDSGKQYNPIPH